MSKFIIGIDTGGTFTDGVLLEKSTGNVIATAKTTTTHRVLATGVARVLEQLLELSAVSSEYIDSVGISTTLATNSVVEKTGSRVALLVIGYVKHFKLPVKAVIFVKGGHTITGEEEEPLDLEYIVSLLGNLKNEVDAYGICSAMSFKNPAHELVIEKAIGMIDPKPVFSSHRISHQAGMRERAATVGLHAKLMPIMQDFIAGVEDALRYHNIESRMVIIGGNGKPIDSQFAIDHAGMTVASGPACTAFFGSLHTQATGVVVDVGGTTTDITLLEGGKPVIADTGCRIGDWQTHVEAIDMVTRGIGGDSHVVVTEDKEVHLGPRRVVPLAVSEHAGTVEKWLGAEGRSKCIRLISQDPEEQKTSNTILSTLLKHGPCTRQKLKEITQLSGIPLEKQLEDLSRKQYIEETGFTPTDALHVLGKLEIGDVKIAKKGAQILGSFLGMGAEEFATAVILKAVQCIENAILDYVISAYWQKDITGFIRNRDNHPALEVNFSLKLPLVGIGAAAPYFLPEVAKRLHTTVTFPEHYEVGNAVGAAHIIG